MFADQGWSDTNISQSWNTGVLMSDSCGYIALSHPPWPKRILVAFRGTYSIANTIADLSTVPQEYIPYPTDGGEGDDDEVQPNADVKCNNCTVHAGFLRSWLNTRDQVVPEIRSALAQYPDYEVVLVGHSLGGAVAALAALELQGHGLHPHVTTFGEPRVGNRELMKYIDARFDLGATPDDAQDAQQSLYRRVTHVNDPVPLLPLEEWGYYMHAGEVYISKLDLSPDVEDLRRCFGDEDPTCISDSEEDTTPSKLSEQEKHEVQEILAKQRRWLDLDNDVNEEDVRKSHSIFTSGVPPRYRLWELFFAHRDYFWRLGLCIPGGDPKDWWRVYPPKDGQNEKDIGQDEL